MLEHARPREAPLLRHMTDEECRNAVRLRDAQERAGALAHLRDAAGRRGDVRAQHRLDGVDDEQRGVRVLDMRLDGLEVRLAHDEERIRERVEAVGAHAHLPRALLARHVEHRLPLPRDLRARLEREARLADARIADDEHHRARDHAAAEHAVELRRARREARQVARLDLRDGLRLLRVREPKAHAAFPRALRLLRHDLLHHRIPAAAARALAEPLQAVIAALLTHIPRLFLSRHPAPPTHMKNIHAHPSSLRTDDLEHVMAQAEASASMLFAKSVKNFT